jgi:hypothetical protein
MCTTGEECIEFITTPDKYTKTKISVYAGIQTFTLEGSNYSPKISLLSPMVGAQLNYSIPRWNKSISFQIDVSLAQFKDEWTNVTIIDNSWVYESHIRYLKGIGYEGLKVNGLIASGKLGGKYTFQNKGLFKPLIEGGLMINQLFASSNYYNEFSYSWYRDDEKYHDGHGRFEETDNFFPSPNIMVGFYAGTGFDYSLKRNNSLLFRITYDNSFSVVSETMFKDKMSACQLKLGYTF